MKQKIAAFPYHPFLLALYAPLALFSYNAQEVSATVLFRPVFAVLALAGVLLLVAKLLFRSWQQAALAASLVIILFFSYGHVYNFLKVEPALIAYARHRYLVVVWLAVLGLAVLLITRVRHSSRSLTSIFNIAAAFLLAFPLLQSSAYLVSANRSAVQAVRSNLHSPLVIQPLTAPAGNLPSVYLIVLDAYTRSDALQRDMGFDNSAFVDQLESLGFYVPSCSRPNYDYTMGSLTTVLNLDYLPELQKELAEQNSDVGLFELIKSSRVRAQLEWLGYRMVAFDSGYEWSRVHDADIYLSFYSDDVAAQHLRPFEYMLLKSTALRLLTDYLVKSVQSDFMLPVSQFSEHISNTHYTLSVLPGLANSSEPRFVFAHILVPHWPYVFFPDGSIRDDPVYTTEDLTWEQRRVGYIDSVQFINNQILDVISKILAQSQTPPIIVIMGDHGLTADNRLQNFTAIYLPGMENSSLYAHITPVNIFRVILNQVFGADYPLLPDITYKSSDSETEGPQPAAETAPECQ